MADKHEIYLDNAATTAPWPEVTEAVAGAMRDGFGNASSRHRRGLAAARAVERAEEAILSLVGGGPWKVVFTSGGTEADVLAVLGSVPKAKRTTLVTSDLEHAAIAETAVALQSKGARFVEVSGGASGVVNASDVAALVDRETAMVSIVSLAGEIGTVQPIVEIAKRVKQIEPKCRVHTDAVQALPQLGRLRLCPEIDMITISAHKIHGPQGIGALLCRPNAIPRAQLFGGDQQQGIRPGTFNLPGIVGFGEAARIFASQIETGISSMRDRCNLLVSDILTTLDGATLLGDPAARAPGIAVLAFDGVTSEVLLHTLELRGVLASSSSACHSTRKDPPRSLVNAGLRRNQGAVRFSLTVDTTREEIEGAVRAVLEAVRALRSGRVGDL